MKTEQIELDCFKCEKTYKAYKVRDICFECESMQKAISPSTIKASELAKRMGISYKNELK